MEVKVPISYAMLSLIINEVADMPNDIVVEEIEPGEEGAGRFYVILESDAPIEEFSVHTCDHCGHVG